MDKDDLIELIQIPIAEIIEEILKEAARDLKITAEESDLINGIKADLSDYETEYQKLLAIFDSGTNITKPILEGLIDEQNDIFLKLIEDTSTRIEADGTISKDEISLFKHLAKKLDSLINQRSNRLASIN